LASAWHAVPDVSRAYLSFQELTYVVGALGMAGALDLFGSADLICLDEFELDDPGNTMLATSFVRGALDRGAHIIATSNTLPSDLGRGRFNADEFKREIGQLAAAFESIGIDGEDYRHRRYAGGGPPERLLPAGGRPPVALPAIDWSALLAGLAAVHPIRYGRNVASLDGLWVRDVESIPEQDTALRVVYFMDKLYDYRVPLALSGDVSLDSLFPSTYGYGSFERKFRRCRSRLYEMLTEPIDVMAIRPAAADD
jgi:cell division protein ZapE